MADLECVRSFVKVAEAGSFAAASERLKLPRSTVSRHIARLEQDLKQSLVYRTTRRLELTSAGRQLFVALRDHVQAIEAGLSASHGNLLTGTLRLTAPEDYGVAVLAPIICEFGSLNPGVSLELIFSERLLDLVKETIDVAVRIGGKAPQGALARRIGSIGFRLVASPRYLSRFPGTLTVEDLENVDFITYGPRPGQDVLKLSKGKREVRLKIRPRILSGSMPTLCEMAAGDQGVALVPQFVADPVVKQGRVVEVCPGWTPQELPVFALTLAQRGTSPLIRRFIDLVVERLGMD